MAPRTAGTAISDAAGGQIVSAPGTPRVVESGPAAASATAAPTHQPEPGLAAYNEDRDRLIFLSDGVFAIAMTLTALEIRPPEHPTANFAELLDALAAPFQGFFWSFLSTALFWATHRRQFKVIPRVDGILTALTLVMLGEITLVPVATRVLTSVPVSPPVLSMYLILFLGIGMTNAVIWLYATWGARLVAWRPGPALTVSIAVTVAFLPVVNTALGVLSMLPRYRLLPMLIPVSILLSTGLRRGAAAFDRWLEKRRA